MSLGFTPFLLCSPVAHQVAWNVWLWDVVYVKQVCHLNEHECCATTVDAQRSVRSTW